MVHKVNPAYYHRSIFVACDLLLVTVLLYLFYRIAPQVIPSPIAFLGRSVFLVSTITFFFATWMVWKEWRQSLPSIRWIVISTLKLSVIYCASCFVTLRLIYDAGEFFSFILLYLPICFITLVTANIILLLLIRSQRMHHRVDNVGVYVGEAHLVAEACREMDSNLQSTYIMRGYYASTRGEDAEYMPKYLGTPQQLLERIQSKATHDETCDIQDVFYCSALDDDNTTKLMRACDRSLIRFHFVPFTKDNLLSSLTLERVSKMYVFTAHLHPIFYFENKLIKRTFDVIVSFIVCILMIPLLPLVAWLIKRQSKGPFLFTQQRTGLDGKTFTCYKFRSMHMNKESDTLQATKNDKRIFPFGEFLRKTNLDEFPQFFNVLRGDMSIVGPRPHMTKHTREYSALVDKFMIRHFSKPGITGWAQITGCRGETKEVKEMEERIRKDIYYIEHWSFWLDIKIILLTFKSIFIPDKKAY